MKFKQVLQNEIHYLLKGKYPFIIIIIALPILFTFLFGDIYHENVVKNIPLVIYDQDQSSLSRNLVQTYNDSERFSVVSYVSTQEEMEEKISSGEALVGLGIPVDFSKNTKKGLTSTIILIVDSSNNMFGNAALSTAQEINRTFSVGVGQRLMEGIGILPDRSLNMVYPVHFGIRILNNPTNGYTPFMLSGLMLNGLQIGLMLIIGPLIFIECRRKKYGREYPTILLLACKLIPSWVTAMVAYAVSLSILHYVFDVAIRGSFFDLFVLGGSFVFVVICSLMFLSAFSPSEAMSLEIPLLYIMPGLLFSGLSWPAFAMNDTAWVLSHILPMAYAGDNLRDLTLSGYAPRLWIDAGYMLLLGIIFIILATLIVSIRRKYNLKELLQGHMNRLLHKKGVS